MVPKGLIYVTEQGASYASSITYNIVPIGKVRIREKIPMFQLLVIKEF